MQQRFSWWRSLGRGLSLYLILGGYFYLLVVPSLPHLLASPAPLSFHVPATSKKTAPIHVSGPNRLTIAQISVDGLIHEGGIDALSKGIWHRPNSSSPDKGGNTVLVSHRFLTLFGPDTFYLLDRLTIGDQFTIAWNGQLYTYQVFQTEIVPSTKVDIENNTPDAEVTLYTCTPLWSSQNRWVVRARLL